ncbi:MAG: hypothetical protein IJ637_02545 [Prevotella sp.]|nr:hypothetical protein [Prevotella sp.]
MNKKLTTALAVVIALLVAGVGYLGFSLSEEKKVNKQMQELAALDKSEMESEYEKFDAQYSEMKTRISNDSIVEQLTREQARTQKLLEELRRTKADDAATITRLKKELASAREMIQQYAYQVDSLNRLNAALTADNTRLSGELAQSNQANMALTSSNTALSEKVAIAATLNATNISLTPRTNKGKAKENMKSGDYVDITFTITKNPTAPVGKRTVYMQLYTPNGNGQALRGGDFLYKGKMTPYTAKLDINYTGEETTKSLNRSIDWSTLGGTYIVKLYADDSMIGTRTFTFKK